jgi:uncharacterized membrane protein
MNAAQIPMRLPGIDVLRGIAVAAMIIFHFAWDLRFFGFIATDISQHPFWANFARAIAGSFLLLSGISLVLLTRDGFDRYKFLRRLGIIGGAALLVTIGTFFAMPQAFIFFGILHCIALSSLLALPLLRTPVAVTTAVALAVFALPFVFTHPVFDMPWLQWLGLGTRFPLTNDYVPVFPWFALALAGAVIGRLIMAAPPRWLQLQPSGVLAFTARAGRLSLPIYLLHQPVLMALIGAASLAMPASGPDRNTVEFRQSCQQTCVKAGETAEVCTRYCICSEDEIRRSDLWTPLLRNNLTARQQQQVTAVTEQCQAKAR